MCLTCRSRAGSRRWAWNRTVTGRADLWELTEHDSGWDQLFGAQGVVYLFETHYEKRISGQLGMNALQLAVGLDNWLMVPISNAQMVGRLETSVGDVQTGHSSKCDKRVAKSTYSIEEDAVGDSGEDQ